MQASRSIRTTLTGHVNSAIGRPPSVSAEERSYVLAPLLGSLWALTTVDYSKPDSSHCIAFIVGLLCATLASIRYRASAALTVLYILVVSLAARVHLTYRGGSDVLDATDEAIQVVLARLNPYQHVFHHTNPVGSPFPYFPGEVLYYGLWKILIGSIYGVEIIAGCVIIGCLALSMRYCGLDRGALIVIVYATSPFFTVHTIDGSNETSLCMLIILAAIGLANYSQSRHIGFDSALFIACAVPLGLALSFKVSAIFFVVPILAYVWRTERKAVAFIATTLLIAMWIILPLFIADPHAMVMQIWTAMHSMHTTPYGINIWTLLAATLGGVPPRAAEALSLAPFVAGLVALSAPLVFRPYSVGVALLQGSLLFSVVCLTLKWSTSAYYDMAGTIAAAGLMLIPLTGTLHGKAMRTAV